MEVGAAAMMRTAVAIFVKTPGLSAVKTRLAAGIGAERAEAFYRLSARAVAQSVRDSGFFGFWAVGEEAGVGDPLWSGFDTLYTGAGDLGARQHSIYSTLLLDYDRVLLIGADAPQISGAVLRDAAAALDGGDFVMGSARDGGYYLFGGHEAVDQDIWMSVPWSTDKTYATLARLLPAPPVLLPPLTDVDTVDDLRPVVREMPASMSATQKAVTDWVHTVIGIQNKEMSS